MDALLLLAATTASVGYTGHGGLWILAARCIARRRDIARSSMREPVLSPKLFAGAPDGPFSLNLLFDRAMEAGRLCGMRLEGVWMHVGTPEAVAAAEAAIMASAA